MWDAVTAGVIHALASLFIAGAASLAFRMAKDTGARRGLRAGALPVLGGCLLLAAFAAGTVGNATCEDTGDPIRGSCEERADDGYEATDEQRVEQFFYIFCLLFIPAGIGLAEGNNKRR